MRKRKEGGRAGHVAPDLASTTSDIASTISDLSSTKLAKHTKSVYDLVPLPLGRTTCIRVIKIRPTLDHYDDIACDFSVIDLSAAESAQEEKSQQPVVHRTLPRWIRTCIHKATCNLYRHGTPRTPDARVDYQALSYTWGNSHADRVIYLDGMPVNVRQNLWDFLNRARRNGVTGYIWIDAVCIDQTTVGERNHQVAMMGDIYSRASCVIVWLGTGYSNTLEKLETCLDHYRPLDYESCKKLCSKDDFIYEEVSFLPYWSRAWIVQEYYLARRKDIWYGSLIIDPNELKFLVELWDEHLASTTRSPAAKLLRAQKWVDSWKAGRHDFKYDTLVHLFEIFQDLACADPRDRLYALMSLLSPEERMDLGTVPDYSQSATKLYLHVFLRLTHDLQQDQAIHPHDALHQLERTLRPDLQDRAVQLAILDLRARCDAYARNPLLDDVYDHRCGADGEEYPRIDAQGCSRCHKIPTVSCEWNNSTQYDETQCFSPRDWIVWVRALLASENGLDRELGAKIRNDRDFSRWDWNATGPYYGDVRPQKGVIKGSLNKVARTPGGCRNA